MEEKIFVDLDIVIDIIKERRAALLKTLKDVAANPQKYIEGTYNFISGKLQETSSLIEALENKLSIDLVHNRKYDIGGYYTACDAYKESLKSKEPVIPVPESHRIFCPSDRKILSYLSKKEIDKLERFMEDYRHLTLWANKSVPKMRTAYGLNPDKLPIRGQVFCYVDCYGRVYSSLDAVAEFYQVETTGGPLTSFANYAAKHADKIRIPEFNSDKNAYIFWHLNFKDHRGQKVSIIKMYRCDLYEWEKDDKFDSSIFYSRRIHQFASYAVTVMHAREHVNDD